MITKLVYDKDGYFQLSGTFKSVFIDMRTRHIEYEKLFSFMIELLMTIKKTVYKNLSDDERILGDERIQVIDALDEFLSLVMAFALVNSEKGDFYSDNFGDDFEIQVRMNKMLHVSAIGKLLNVEIGGVEDFRQRIDTELIENFKSLIVLFNNPANRAAIRSELVRLIYNVFVFRYKLEYV